VINAAMVKAHLEALRTVMNDAHLEYYVEHLDYILLNLQLSEAKDEN
jgi:hypothetical protein